MTQQIVIQPLGLVTQPNKLGSIPEGSFSNADRVYMRDPGTVELANQWQIGSGTFASADMGWCMLPDPTTALYVRRATGTGLWFYQWYDVVGNAFSFGPIQLEDDAGTDCYIDDTGRWSSSTFRERTLLMCRRGTLIFDFAVPTTAPQADPRSAGLFPPTITSSITAAVGFGALADHKVTHCTAIFRRTYADGYVVVSPPSVSSMDVTWGFGGPANITQVVYFNAPRARAGDVVEFYRTRSQASELTGSTNTGQDYYLSTTYTLTSTDITNGFTGTIIDSVPDEGLGTALYTNAGVSGADASAYPPPTAKCVTEFRGYTFFGNRIDPPSFQFRVPVFWGGMFGSANPLNAVPEQSRRFGLGRRSVTGTATNTSSVITAVPAADIVGIVIGQRMFPLGGFWTIGAIVTAVGATTVTLDTPSTGSGSVTVTVVDIMEIDGVRHNAETIDTLAVSIASANRFAATNTVFFSCLGLVFPPTSAGSTNSGGQTSTLPADMALVSRLIVTEGSTSLSVRATNGNNYSPRLPRIEAAEAARVFTETAVPNGLSWSEEGQPENCPATNIQPIGRSEIIGLHSTRDCLWITCTDGLYRLSGTGGKVGQGYDWRVDPVDKTLVLAQPQAWCVIRDQFHLYANRGWCVVDSDGTVNELSNGRIDDLMPGQGWIPVSATPASTIWMVADNTHDEVYLRVVPASGADVGRVYIYNLKTDAITADTTDIAGITPAGPIVCNLVFSSAIRGLFGVIAYQSLTRVTQCYAAVETSNRATANITYQPLYVDNPFTVKQWQTFSLALETAGAPSNLSVLAFANATSMNVRSPSGTSTPDFSRVGFGIPRNAPAVANMIAPALQVAVNNPSPNRVKLQGFALEFSEYTEQRKKR